MGPDQTSKRPEADQKSKVLVIDDDPLMRRIVMQCLGNSTYELLEAESGPAGIQYAIEQRPALILLDVMMPEMDGFEVIRHLRTNHMTLGVPIILLTALGEMNDKVFGMQLGADDYVTKPFDPRELRVRVQTHLKRSEQYLQSNPLTSLPGNPAIEHIIRVRIAAGTPLAVVYFDLSNFKSFNDRYGWLGGDQIIQRLGEIIVTTAMGSGDKDIFVGHIGGDDFVVVTRPDYAQSIGRQAIRAFDQVVPDFYSLEDRTRGYVEMADRSGTLRRVPMVSLRVAVVTNEHRSLENPVHVAEIAAELKRYLKTLSGSQIAFDRRTR